MGNLLRFISPSRGAIILSVMLMTASTVVALIYPLLAGRLTSTLLENDTTTDSLLTIIAIWGGLMLVRALLKLSNEYYLGLLGEQAATRLRNRVYEHMQVLTLAWHQGRRRGQVLSLLSSDADAVSRFVTNTLLPLLPMILTLLGAFVMMVRLDPMIAGLVILGMPAYFLALKLVGREIRPLSRAWVDQYGNLLSRVEENLSMLPALKAFSREGVEKERFRSDNQGLLEIWRKQLRAQSALSPAVDLLAGFGILCLLWLGSRHIEQGVLTPADLVSLLMYAGLLVMPLGNLANAYGQVQRARGSAERLVEFFAEHPEPLMERGPALQVPRGEIRFEGVDFTYPGRSPVLRNLNLTIASGETVAITGLNGAGKSTLAHLLLRFISPDDGIVRIDGVDICQVTLESVRSQVGLVDQRVLLLNGTVEENIAYGVLDADIEAIKQAASMARADEFIENLPDGYQSVIGDEGIKLSGGQRQRVSLARTLLRDPPILVLDEATAMFDPEGERDFLSRSREVLSERTVILITHREASLALADRVLKMENGELTEVSVPAANESA